MPFCSRKRKPKNDLLWKKLTTSIRGSNQKIRTGPFRLELKYSKEILERYHEEKTRGVIIRARARWHEHDERSTKYLN